MSGTGSTTDGKVILYIEDNDDSRVLVRRILQVEGFTMWEAKDARQAMEVLQERIPDLILMDINLPGVDGYVLTAQLKSMPRLQKIPIIALTANVMKGDRERSLAAGCDEYIQKPIDVDNLGRQLTRLLAPERSS
jgi:two-component system cell cycle response regulator DivK